MNKLIIPVVLLALVVIAAGFAFSPVEQATAVHIDILDAMCVHHFGNGVGSFWNGNNCTSGN